MNVDDARKILEEDRPAFNLEKNRILNGLNLLASVLPDDNMLGCAEHDQIWACGFEESVELMTEEQIRRMHSWGWFEAEESWSHFV